MWSLCHFCIRTLMVLSCVFCAAASAQDAEQEAATQAEAEAETKAGKKTQQQAFQKERLAARKKYWLQELPAQKFKGRWEIGLRYELGRLTENGYYEITDDEFRAYDDKGLAQTDTYHIIKHFPNGVTLVRKINYAFMREGRHQSSRDSWQLLRNGQHVLHGMPTEDKGWQEVKDADGKIGYASTAYDGIWYPYQFNDQKASYELWLVRDHYGGSYIKRSLVMFSCQRFYRHRYDIEFFDPEIIDRDLILETLSTKTEFFLSLSPEFQEKFQYKYCLISDDNPLYTSEYPQNVLRSGFHINRYFSLTISN